MTRYLLTLCLLLLAPQAWAASVALTWTDNSTSANKATKFGVCRQTGATGAFTEIAQSTTTSYTDTTVADGTAYVYKVMAYNSKGEKSNFSNTHTAAVPQPAPPLNAPSNLSGTVNAAAAEAVEAGGTSTAAAPAPESAPATSGTAVEPPPTATDPDRDAPHPEVQ